MSRSQHKFLVQFRTADGKQAVTPPVEYVDAHLLTYHLEEQGMREVEIVEFTRARARQFAALLATAPVLPLQLPPCQCAECQAAGAATVTLTVSPDTPAAPVPRTAPQRSPWSVLARLRQLVRRLADRWLPPRPPSARTEAAEKAARKAEAWGDQEVGIAELQRSLRTEPGYAAPPSVPPVGEAACDEPPAAGSPGCE